MSILIVPIVSFEGTHTGRSGYPVLFDYIQCPKTTVTRRRGKNGFWNRVLGRMARLGSATNWAEVSSFKMEWIAASVPGSLLHLSWADRDWGYLDRWLFGNRKEMVGTFHACPDDFQSIIRAPKRLQNFSAVILMSEVQRENFEKAGMPPERIHVIHHGIDTKHFVPAEPKPEPSDRFTALHVGSYRRNFDDLEAVCDKLRTSPNIQIKIITSPKIGARFANKPNVEVVSGLSDAELLKAYQDADCLLMTAEAATANNAILEGIACGLPVVTQQVGGIPEYVNKDCAFLCEAGDSDALVNALERLQADLDLCTRMGQAARARALELDWVHVAAKTQAVYDQVLAERHQ